jgi:cysteine sulfinate desulfinase/cysteine desulfurase-like protein
MSQEIEKKVEELILGLSQGNQERHGTHWVWPGSVYLAKALREAMAHAYRDAARLAGYRSGLALELERKALEVSE